MALRAFSVVCYAFARRFQAYQPASASRCHSEGSELSQCGLRYLGLKATSCRHWEAAGQELPQPVLGGREETGAGQM